MSNSIKHLKTHLSCTYAFLITYILLVDDTFEIFAGNLLSVDVNWTIPFDQCERHWTVWELKIRLYQTRFTNFQHGNRNFDRSMQ